MSMQQQERAPPAYTTQEPESLHLPSVPTHSFPSAPSTDRLPGLRSLDLPDASAHTYSHLSRTLTELSPKTHAQSLHWTSLTPLTNATFPRAPEGIPRMSTEMELGSPTDTTSIASVGDDYTGRREMSAVSMDDPDVRLAAEALSGLGNLDFNRSPTARSLTLPQDSTAPPEPLLSLITSNHPWLGGTINGSISAYNTTKSYSPRFVKYSAELLERNIGSPVVNTVSSVGRRTGVEQNLRRYLGEMHRRPSDLEAGDTAARKRQRVMSPASDAMEIEDAFHSARIRGESLSSYAESLPAYDDQRSPKYEESPVNVIDPATGKQTETQVNSNQDRRVNWSTQLIMTTSGLGVALSDTSLRSLKICVGLLRSATKHIDSVMHALRLVLEEYETALRNRRQPMDEGSSDIRDTSGTASIDPEKEERVRLIADRMKTLSSDIWATLQNVVQSVSRYTGGALPQNASQVVRTQLLSVPQRWQSASRSAAAESGEEVRGANRMLAFAREGLDMIGNITTVVDGTIQSGEGWLARMGRRTLVPNPDGNRQQDDKGSLGAF